MKESVGILVLSLLSIENRTSGKSAENFGHQNSVTVNRLNVLDQSPRRSRCLWLVFEESIAVKIKGCQLTVKRRSVILSLNSEKSFSQVQWVKFTLVKIVVF